MNKKNFTRKEKSAYYSQCMQMYQGLYDLTKKQIAEKGYASHKNLFNKICSTKNIVNAIRSISKNTGGRTAGVDGTTIKDIKKYNNNEMVKKIQNKLRSGNYQPKRIKRIYIPKANGDMRPLGIPTIEDRIIQQAIKQVIEPIAEAQFSRISSGFRPGRSAHNSMAQVDKMIQMSKMSWCIKCDIKGFFDNVDHNRLIKALWSFGIRDKTVISIIKTILKTEIVDMNGNITKPEKGTPQGGIISPLLANIYLDALDKWIESQWTHFETKHTYYSEKRTKEYQRPNQNKKYRALRENSAMKEMYIVRYADDFLIFTNSKENAEKIKIATVKWLRENLKLECSPDKTKIIDLQNEFAEFLGFKFKISNRIKETSKGSKKYVIDSHIADNALKNIKEKLYKQIDYIATASDNITFHKAIQIYNSMVMGMHNYYCVAHGVNNDFHRIGWDIQKRLYNRVLNDYPKRNQQPAQYKPCYQAIVNKYGTSKELKWCNGIPVIPVRYVQFKAPQSFNEGYNLYDIKNNLNTINLEDMEKVIAYFSSAVHNTRDSVELYENKISRLVSQKALCYITNQPLIYGEIATHHIIPVHLGGTDEYENIIIVQERVHEIIHHSKSLQEALNMMKKEYKMGKRMEKKFTEIYTKANPIKESNQ